MSQPTAPIIHMENSATHRDWVGQEVLGLGLAMSGGVTEE